MCSKIRPRLCPILQEPLAHLSFSLRSLCTRSLYRRNSFGMRFVTNYVAEIHEECGNLGSCTWAKCSEMRHDKLCGRTVFASEPMSSALIVVMRHVIWVLGHIQCACLLKRCCGLMVRQWRTLCGRIPAVKPTSVTWRHSPSIFLLFLDSH